MCTVSSADSKVTSSVKTSLPCKAPLTANALFADPKTTFMFSAEIASPPERCTAAAPTLPKDTLDTLDTLDILDTLDTLCML